MTAPPLHGSAAGFPLSLYQAAQILDMTPDAVTDLVRTGLLGAYLAAEHEIPDRPALRFDPAALETMAASLSAATATPALAIVATVHAVAAGLRDYLAQRSPADTHSTAQAGGRPLLAADQRGTTYAHVKPEYLTAFLRERYPTGDQMRVRLTLPDAVTRCLTRLGCRAKRGIRPVGQVEQVWEIWWRVPLSMWSLDPTLRAGARDFAALVPLDRQDTP